MTNSSDQLARRHTVVTSSDHASPVQNLLSTSLFQQRTISQRQSPADLHCSEFSETYGNLKKKKTLERLKSDNDQKPLFKTSYQNADLRTSQLVCPEKLSICIQRKALNLEIPTCKQYKGNVRKDSCSSNCLETSNSQISEYRHPLSMGFTPMPSLKPSWSKHRNFSAVNQGKMLSPSTLTKDKALHKQKSFGASKSRISFYPQNQFNRSNQLHLSQYDMVRQCMPLSRYSLQSSASCHSHSTPFTSKVQRKSYAGVKESPLDYNDFKILNSVLDQAFKTAKNMQKTTEKIIQKLSSDLVNSTLHYSSSAD
ncbi:uncharacterized protein [Pyxicephalus adspersus]|uniref:uncharacterized protein isoform X2 n=1 Tax=Pyxicephalus adspersus TaxID=30357 RepID=UPI003B59C70D